MSTPEIRRKRRSSAECKAQCEAIRSLAPDIVPVLQTDINNVVSKAHSKHLIGDGIHNDIIHQTSEDSTQRARQFLDAISNMIKFDDRAYLGFLEILRSCRCFEAIARTIEDEKILLLSSEKTSLGEENFGLSSTPKKSRQDPGSQSTPKFPTHTSKISSVRRLSHPASNERAGPSTPINPTGNENFRPNSSRQNPNPSALKPYQQAPAGKENLGLVPTPMKSKQSLSVMLREDTTAPACMGNFDSTAIESCSQSNMNVVLEFGAALEDATKVLIGLTRKYANLKDSFYFEQFQKEELHTENEALQRTVHETEEKLKDALAGLKKPRLKASPDEVSGKSDKSQLRLGSVGGILGIKN